MNSTTPDQNNEKLVVNEPLPETLQMLMEEHIRETEKIWTTLSPFQREELMLEAILELSLNPLTEALVVMPMEVLSLKPVNEKERNNELSKE